MLEQSTDRLFHMMVFLIMLPALVAVGFFLFEDEIISVTTGEQTELVADSKSTDEALISITVDETEEPSDEEYDLSASMDSLIDSGVKVLGNRFVVVASIVAAIVGIGLLWTLIKSIYDSEVFQRLLFSLWMKAHKTPVPLQNYYLFLDKYKSVLPERISKERMGLYSDIVDNKKPMRYAHIAFMDHDFIDAVGKLTVIVKNKAYLKTFKKHYSEPTKVELETIYNPIEKAMAAYTTRKSEFHQLRTDTDENELNLLLSQSFKNIKPFRKFQ